MSISTAGSPGGSPAGDVLRPGSIGEAAVSSQVVNPSVHVSVHTSDAPSACGTPSVSAGDTIGRESADQIINEWFPVIGADDVTPGTWHTFDLLDDRFLLTCDLDGRVLVARDTCPHRGAQLSLGTFDGSTVQCPYHGWQFDGTGRCVHRPAHPTQEPPEFAALRPIAAQLAYGLWWICVGPTPRNLPAYEAFDRHPGLTVAVGPKVLRSSGPRIVENFLDMAHFPYVHADYLGQVPHTEVSEYDVDVVAADGIDGGAIEITNCVFWQPLPGPTATEGGPVAYVYGVTHPYAAMLTKIPSEADGGEAEAFNLLIVASPMTETACRVWLLTTVRNPAADLDSFREFNAQIFAQDVRTVESQRPALLPLDTRAEVHQRADKASLAYRKWLATRAIRYGTC